MIHIQFYIRHYYYISGEVVLVREHTTDSAPSLVNDFQVHKRIEFGDEFGKTPFDKHG